MGWIAITDPYSGEILCRYEPDAELIEIQRRKRKILINLKLHRLQARRAQENKPQNEKQTETKEV